MQPKLVADLGCGTGSFCLEMASRGYNMIGVDSSVEMLSQAISKLADSEIIDKQNILFLNQDMVKFELYGTVDAIVSLLDSINYLTNKKDLEKVIGLIKNYLNPGGLFIFDVNSEYKFKTILANNVYYSVNDDITYIWQNAYNEKTKICKFDLTFFVKKSMKKNELYSRFDEIHFERAYSVEELEQLLKKAGLEIIGIYNNLSFDKPSKNSERLFFICKKVCN